MFKYYQKTKNFLIQNEKYLSPFVMLCGFVVDSLTLRRIDLLVENLIILSYLLVAGICILYINFFEAREYVELEEGLKSWFKRLFDFKKHKETTLEKLSIFAPFVMQFAFGGLFSVFVVFYSRSSSIFTSWPFLIFLVLMLIGNEFFRERYQRLTFQVSIYFIAIFSYCVFVVPVLVGQIGMFSFLLSGAVSLVLINLVFRILQKIIPKKFELSRLKIYKSIGAIYSVFNILYFSNIIPPIPLSLTEDGVFHELKRNSPSSYAVKYEPAPWYLPFREIHPVFHWRPGEPIYYYSAIFAPTKISTKIYHRWSFYDDREGSWVVRGKLDFPIVGGRDGGYRGYSYKHGIEEGKWRVEVVTERGQILGRDTFKVEKVEEKVKLMTGVR